jgi:hypothetical protein
MNEIIHWASVKYTSVSLFLSSPRHIILVLLGIQFISAWVLALTLGSRLCRRFDPRFRRHLWWPAYPIFFPKAQRAIRYSQWVALNRVAEFRADHASDFEARKGMSKSTIAMCWVLTCTSWLLFVELLTAVALFYRPTYAFRSSFAACCVAFLSLKATMKYLRSEGRVPVYADGAKATDRPVSFVRFVSKAQAFGFASRTIGERLFALKASGDPRYTITVRKLPRGTVVASFALIALRLIFVATLINLALVLLIYKFQNQIFRLL